MKEPYHKDQGVSVNVVASTRAFHVVLIAALGGNGALGIYNFLLSGCDGSEETQQCQRELAEARRAADRYLDAIARYDKEAWRSRKPGAQPVETWTSEPPSVVYPEFEDLK